MVDIEQNTLYRPFLNSGLERNETRPLKLSLKSSSASVDPLPTTVVPPGTLGIFATTSPVVEFTTIRETVIGAVVELHTSTYSAA